MPAQCVCKPIRQRDDTLGRFCLAIRDNSLISFTEADRATHRERFMLRCFQRCLHRSCGHCAWGCRRRVSLHGHCDGTPVASDSRWAVTSFLFLLGYLSFCDGLRFLRRAPVSTGNTQYKVSNPSGRFAFNTSLGQNAPPLDSGQGPSPCIPRRRCRPAPGPEGLPPSGLPAAQRGHARVGHDPFA